MSMTLQIQDAAHLYGLDDFDSISPDATPAQWGFPSAVEHSWGPGPIAVGDSGYVTAYYANGFDTETDVFGSLPGVDTVTGMTLYAGATTLWQMTGVADVAPSQLDAGVPDAVLLGGDDSITGNSWDNRLEGFGGNDFIDGGRGTDTAVFSGSMASTAYAIDGSAIHTAGPDGYDTLVGIERLEFDDYGIAFDVHGTAGEAYRLYQAAFDRAPDVGGLGYQMHALDEGLPLSRVAANFIASPEFQHLYGPLTNTQFVVQLYENVLHRDPDAAGLAYHVSHLNAGVSRADVLVGFSESPENQANVIGQIDHGMVYAPVY